ncbi:MAG: heparan-alpha-glucosaminide N-acetyltransferase [Thermoplasmatota archaeon]
MKNTRLWEIDALRGIAVIMMIIFHVLYDLNYFQHISINLHNNFFYVHVYFTASLFLVLVGISMTLSYSKAKKILTKKKLFWKFLKRGFFIFCLGLLITLVSWLYLQNGFIIFGVLHCIGISIILAYPFIRYIIQPFILGLLIITVGIFLKTLTFDFPWLLWLGFTPHNFYTIDYFPLLPWFGVILIGISLGNIFYENGLRTFTLKDKTHFKIINITTFLGRHSLIIYFLHQIILISMFTLLSFFK